MTEQLKLIGKGICMVYYFGKMGQPGRISLGQAVTPRGLATRLDMQWTWASYWSLLCVTVVNRKAMYLIWPSCI